MRERLSNIKTKISKEYLDIKMFVKGKENKYQVLFSLFGVLLAVICVVGVSYATWTKTSSGGNNSISTGTITMRYVENTSVASINNATPMSASDAYQSNNYFPFQVVMEASGNATLNYEITITTQDTTTYTYDIDQKVRIGLKKENSIITDAGFNIEGSQNNVDYTNGVIVGTLPTTGTSLTGNPQTVYKGTITSNGTETIDNFKLYLWLDSNATATNISEKYAFTINVNTGDTAPNYQRYTLTYSDDEGTGCTTKQVRRNTPWGELCTPTADSEYHFQGWYTGQSGTGTQITSTTTASANQTVYAYYTSNTLYYVLKSAAKVGTYAHEYTGSHQDSMNASLSTKKIYHWYASDATAGTAILDKNNVIFANHCWQMIRTTDTGGVRMIYNGEVVDGKCLNTRGNHVGYGGDRSSQSLNGTYWYGTDYTYDSSTSKFSLSGTTSSTQVTSSNASTVIPTLVGKYTCRSKSETGTCSTLYLIESYKSSYDAYAIKLTSSSNYSQFGTIQFNDSDNAASPSPAHVGYMYNATYSSGYKNYSSETLLTAKTLSTSYYYADSYDYNETTANKYTLTNPYQVSSTSDYPSLVGKYTLLNTSSTYSNTSIYYIAAVAGITMYCIQLFEGHDLAYYNNTYTYGDSYTDNGNGTYTINNPTTINRTEYFANYDNIYGKYICKNATNNTCSEIWHSIINTLPDQSAIYYYKSTNLYKYAKGFTYNSTTGEYTLNSDSVTFWNPTDTSNIASLSTHHYTCFDTTGVCSTLSYVHSIKGGNLYYTNLHDGNGIEDALEEMFSANNVNTRNSIVKTGIDAWYKKYLLTYDSYIDDTIYCNDRSIRSLGGWNPDGGSISDRLQFKENTLGSDLSCTNITDKFSVSNSRAQLTYKVGLMSSPEMNLLNQNNARKTGKAYDLLSPYYFSQNNASKRCVGTDGSFSGGGVNSSGGVRPAISLKAGIGYTSGDGSMANPYIVDTN